MGGNSNGNHPKLQRQQQGRLGMSQRTRQGDDQQEGKFHAGALAFIVLRENTSAS